MPHVDLTHAHTMSTDDARAAVERVAQDLEDEYGIPYRWEGDTLQFEGKGADGRLDVAESDVHLAIDLSWLLRTTVGADRIRREAEQLLDEHLR